MTDIYGCDIGNGFCYISVLKDRNTDPKGMLPAKLADEGMPSVAYVADSGDIEVYSNKSALAKYGTKRPRRLVHAIKTRLGEGTITVDGMNVNTDDVYAAITRDLVILGNQQRKSMGLSPVYDLVFTFPNLFVDDIDMLNRMQKSIEKVKIEGHRLKVVARIPEAAAVAIDYLYYMKNVISDERKIKSKKYTVLVYDLGHGTFDTSVVRAEDGKTPELLIKDYALPIGGKNFDEAIVNELCGQLRQKYNHTPQNDIEKEKIRSLAVEIKHKLKDDSECSETINIDDDYFDVSLSRSRFEEITYDLLLQTISKTCDLLDEAKRKKVKIDAIVLSGGASQMPMVKNALEKIFTDEKIPVRIYRPSTAVSFGAARYALGEKERIEEEKRRKKEENEKKANEKLKTHEIILNRSRSLSHVNRFAEDEEVFEKEFLGFAASSKELEQVTDYSYGLLLNGHIQMLIKSNEKLPATHRPIKLIVENGEVELRVFRSREKGSFDIISDVEKDGYSIQRFKFFFEKMHCSFEVSITVLENYNIRVVCKTDYGITYSKSTFDTIDVLLGKGEGHV